MGDLGASGCRRGQSGFTMVEATIVIIIASIAVLSVAIGLQTAVTADNRANDQQRLNLAVTTFTESVKQSPWSWWSCPAISNPPPSSVTLDPNAPVTEPSHAHLILRRAIDAAPEVQEWIDRGVTYVISDVRYWDPASGDWRADDPADPPCAQEDYRWPAAKVSFEACWNREGADDCTAATERRTLTGEAIKRGPRDVRVTIPGPTP